MSIAARKRSGNRAVQSPGDWYSRGHHLSQKALARFDIDSKRCPYPTPPMGTYGPEFGPSNTPRASNAWGDQKRNAMVESACKACKTDSSFRCTAPVATASMPEARAQGFRRAVARNTLRPSSHPPRRQPEHLMCPVILLSNGMVGVGQGQLHRVQSGPGGARCAQTTLAIRQRG